MTKDKSKVFLFIDDDIQPIAELETPIVFDLDTKKLADGEHVLKIVSQSPSGKEGIRKTFDTGISLLMALIYDGTC